MASLFFENGALVFGFSFFLPCAEWAKDKSRKWMENAAVSINVWGFFFSATYTHTSRAGAGRCLNNTQNNPRRKHSLCVYITNPACRNARRVVSVVFLLFNFICLFVCLKKRKNCEGCREWSHVTDVGKMRIFHRIAGFILWWIVVYACDQNSSYILVIYFSLSLHFQVIIIVGTGRRVHHCNRRCKYIRYSPLSGEWGK